MDRRALRDRHLGLGDGAVSDELDRRPAEEMEDADALFPALAPSLDKARARRLEPGREHVAVVVPAGTEPVPIAGIAPDCPRLDVVADGELVARVLGHHQGFPITSRSSSTDSD